MPPHAVDQLYQQRQEVTNLMQQTVEITNKILTLEERLKVLENLQGKKTNKIYFCTIHKL